MRRQKWQLETPGLTIPKAPDIFSALDSQIDSRLLQHWIEKTCQMMVLNPEINPLSYPILQLLDLSPWLAPVLQSISAGYENDFEPTRLTDSFLQRHRALASFRKAVVDPDTPLASVLLGIFLLGVSTTWLDGDVTQFGKEHLSGGRKIFDLMLSKQRKQLNSFDSFVIGTYVYWDMSCSLLVDPSEQTPLNTSSVYSIVQEMSQTYHPMSGFAIELFYLLSTLGRHCRVVLDTGQHDYPLESTMEEQLLGWRSSQMDDQLFMLSEAFRMHGLILLYRICGMPPAADDIPGGHVSADDFFGDDLLGGRLFGDDLLGGDALSSVILGDQLFEGDAGDAFCEDLFDNDILGNEVSGDDALYGNILDDDVLDLDEDVPDSTGDVEEMIHRYALEAIEALSHTPIESSNFAMQPIPLLTAGSELWEEDVCEREQVMTRFRALFSVNRTPVNLWAMTLLREHWELRRQGRRESWVQLMLRKGWRLTMG